MKSTLAALRTLRAAVLDSFLRLFNSLTQFASGQQSISQPQEVAAYYKAQNKRFPQFFVRFFVGLLSVQTLSLIMVLLTQHQALLLVISQMLILDFFLLMTCTYIFRVSRTLAKRKKPGFVQQTSVRIKFMICGTLPTCMFMLTPITLMSPSGRVPAAWDISWSFYLIVEVYMATGNIGGPLYKVSQFALFNSVYCTLSFWIGLFDNFLLLRIGLPMVMASICIVAFDEYEKENFTLKRTLKRQKDMYRSFFEQIQDPVLIMDRETTTTGCASSSPPEAGRWRITCGSCSRTTVPSPSSRSTSRSATTGTAATGPLLTEGEQPQHLV